MSSIFNIFFLFVGLAVFLSSTSSYVLTNFSEHATTILVGTQIAQTSGNFFSGWLSDRSKWIQFLLIPGLLFSAFFHFFAFQFPSDWILSFVFLFGTRFFLSFNFQLMSIGIIESKGEDSFTRYRVSGTIGFLVSQLFFYLVLEYKLILFKDPNFVASFGSIFYFFCLFLSFWTPKFRISRKPFYFRKALVTIQNPKITFFFLFSFLFYAAYQITDNYMGKYFEILGGTKAIFLAWFLSVIIEVPFLFFSPYLIHRWSLYSVIFASLFCGSIRFFILFLFVDSMEFSKYFLLLQMTHSVLFAGFYIGGFYFLRKYTSSEVYGSVSGLYSIFSMLLGGISGNLICGFLLNAENSSLSKASFQNLFLFSASIFLTLIPLFFFLYSYCKKKEFLALEHHD